MRHTFHVIQACNGLINSTQLNSTSLFSIAYMESLTNNTTHNATKYTHHNHRTRCRYTHIYTHTNIHRYTYTYQPTYV